MDDNGVPRNSKPNATSSDRVQNPARAVQEITLNDLELRERTRKNTFTFIGRLPNEILAEIFFQFMLHLAESDIEPNSGMDFWRCYRWLTVTKVCRHWHSVAIHSPALWSRIFIPTNSAFLKLALERSKGTLLYVVYDDGDCELAGDFLQCLDALEIVLVEALSRIRHMSLNIRPWVYLEIYDVLNQPAPNLRHLGMSSYEEADDDIPEAYLNHQNMPSLQSFATGRNYTIPWSGLPSMSTLRVLGLTGAGVEDANILLSQILDALHGLPFLERLRLSNIAASIDRTTRMVTMSNLKECELTSTPTFCSALLEHLCTPSDMYMSLNYSTVEDSERSLLLSPILSKLSGATTLSPPASIASFGIIIGEASVDLRGWTTLIGLEDPSYRDFVDKRIFHLQLPLNPAELSDILQPLPLQKTQLLRLSPPRYSLESASSFGNTDLVSLASQMPNVTTLICSGWPSEMYRDLLCKPFVTVPESGFVWPSVTTLVLYDIPFSSNVIQSVRGYDVRYVEALRMGLLDRQSRGCTVKLDHLYVRRSSIKEADLDLFQGCATEVIGEHNQEPLWLPNTWAEVSAR